MSIANRLEKLRFIIAEMEFALLLARHAPDDFVARTFARHIVVRTENFIQHARRLRRVLNQARFDVRAYHRKKEAYTRFFDEYFQITRHKLGAHVQDLDFGRRIELWNDVEVGKIGFFVDGAREIYASLGELKLLDFGPYASPAELNDAGLLLILQGYLGSADNRARAEIGSDPLAMARPNTSAVMTFGTVQGRASQLVLIKRWIRTQLDLMGRVSRWPEVARVLKARIITDIVSFCDCLVTRTVGPGALQEMDGLNTLLAREGFDSGVIDRFVRVSDFARALQAARAVRDREGAHLEIEDSVALGDLLREIDAYDLADGLAFFKRVAQVFTKVCTEVPFLRVHAADGRRLYGVTANSYPIKPFDDRNPPAAVPARIIPPRFDSDELYWENLRKWLKGDEIDQHNAREYFCNAFLSSAVAEEITERTELGGGVRYSRASLRTAHQFFIRALASAETLPLFPQILERLITCRGGDPYTLAEILLRCDHPKVPLREELVCYGLGEIAHWPHASVRVYLMPRAQSDGDWTVQFGAILALFKIYLRSEAPARINKRSLGMSYERDIAPLLAGMPDIRQLLCVLAFASQFCSPAFGFARKELADEYSTLQAAVEKLALETLPAGRRDAAGQLLHQLVSTDDYVGVCLLLASELTEEGLGPLADDFLAAACAGRIVAAPHLQATRHLIGCLLRKGRLDYALRLAEDAAERNPDNVALQIVVMQVLAELPGGAERARRKIATIRSGYQLTKEQDDALAGVETRLPGQADVPA